MPFDTSKVSLIAVHEDCDTRNKDTRKEGGRGVVETWFKLQVLVFITMVLITIVPRIDCVITIQVDKTAIEQYSRVVIHKRHTWQAIEVVARNQLKLVPITLKTVSRRYDHRRLKYVGQSLVVMRRDHSHGLVCVTKFNVIKVRRKTSKHLRSMFCQWRAENIEERRRRIDPERRIRKRRHQHHLIVEKEHKRFKDEFTRGRFQNKKSMQFLTIDSKGFATTAVNRTRSNVFDLL